MNKSYEEIEKERAQRIEKHINNKDLNIRVSWALNCATAMVAPMMPVIAKTIEPDSTVEGMVQGWADWYLQYYEELRAREAEKLVGKEDNEKPL